MYWSEWQGEPRIEYAALDGADRHVFLRTGGRVNGLTIDFNQRRLYWVDIDNKTIGSVGLDQRGGNDVRQVVARHLKQPNALTQFEDFIYWTDWEQRTIVKANKTTGENRSVVVDSLTAHVTDLLVYHPNRQNGASQPSPRFLS